MAAEYSSETVASLMASFRKGDKLAASQLFELFYPQLRRLAAARMKGERTEHTWQPTALANELYLELVKIKALRPAEVDEDERAAFFGLAAHLMKRLLILHSRPLSRRVEKVSVSESSADLITPVETAAEIESLLSRLAAIKPAIRTVVEMKVFEGRTVNEIAEEIGCAPITVARYWNFAKNWLQHQLSPAGES